MVATIADAQQVPDPRVADLIRAGKVRVGLFPPQYTKDPVTGELKSVWVEIARALAARIGVQVVLLEYPTPPQVVDCLKQSTVLVRAESRWPRREIPPPNKKSVMGEKPESSQERQRSLGAGMATTPNPPLEPTTSFDG